MREDMPIVLLRADTWGAIGALFHELKLAPRCFGGKVPMMVCRPGPRVISMYRWLLLGLLCFVGCENVVGPLRRPPTRVDDPRLSIPEQEKLGRQYYALPEESSIVAPHSGIAPPGSDAKR